MQKFDIFREGGRIRNTYDEETCRYYISCAKIEGGILFQLKSFQCFSKLFQIA